MHVNLSSKIISTLGNPSSILPLGVKDVVSTSGVTYFANKAGGAVEGKDKFVDEVSTMAVWLGGIPFYKMIIDKTLYKVAKYDPAVDVRIIKDKEYLKTALELAKGTAKDSLLKASKSTQAVKNLFLTKFALSTGLTLATYYGLIKLRHKFTEKNVKEKFIKKQMAQKFANEFIYKQTPPSFKSFSYGKTAANPKQIKFGGSNALNNFMLDPVKNTMLIDLGIASGRVGTSRLKSERNEFIVKEAGIFLFFYCLGGVIQNGIEKIVGKFLHKPIALDARVLASEEFKTAVKTSAKYTQEINEFKKSTKTVSEMLNFIHANPENIAVKTAKISDMIAVEKATNKVDFRKFIDKKAMQNLAQNLENFLHATTNPKFAQKGVENFIKSAKNLKVASILLNMAICCGYVGVVSPNLVYKIRAHSQAGSKEYHVEKQIEQKLALNYK